MTQETKAILDSKAFGKIRAAHEAGEGAKVTVNGRIVQYDPELPPSIRGVTRGDNGFVMGPRAFESAEETTKTVAHELHRLRTSTIKRTGQAEVNQNQGETDAAFDAAEEVAKELHGE